MKHSTNYKKTKVAAAVALVSMFAVNNAQADLLDLAAPASQTSDQTAPVLSVNSALLSATSTITYAVTNLLSFDWFFKANDYLPFNDYSSVMATSVGTEVLTDVATVGDYLNSGWQTYTFSSAYTGNITFGVYNVKDSSHDSTLQIKNVDVTVPEPGTLALLGLGLVGMAARRKKEV